MMIIMGSTFFFFEQCVYRNFIMMSLYFTNKHAYTLKKSDERGIELKQAFNDEPGGSSDMMRGL